MELSLLVALALVLLFVGWAAYMQLITELQVELGGARVVATFGPSSEASQD